MGDLFEELIRKFATASCSEPMKILANGTFTDA
jgi:hypothetical protein